MASTACNASSKIAAVLPKGRRDEIDAIGLFVIPRSGEAAEDRVLGTLRRALRGERQVWLGYRDKAGTLSERTVWPVALGYFDRHQTLVAWCTLLNDYRSFRIDGMTSVELLEAPLPEPRRTLFHRWSTARNLPDLT